MLAPFRKSPYLVSDTVKAMPYAALQSSGPAIVPPRFTENRNVFFDEFSDPIIEIIDDAAANAPAPYSLMIVPLHGAVSRIPIGSTAFPIRNNGVSFGITATWRQPSSREAAVAWVVDTADRLAPHSHGSNYVNVMDIEGDASVRTAYASNYDRLALLKARYDPSNLFSRNENIKPTSAITKSPR